MKGEIRNAVITGTMLGREDHDIMTFMLYVESGAYSVGIGGYALDESGPLVNGRITRKYSTKSFELISRILEVVGVRRWEDLKGKYLRFEDPGLGQTVKRIGNILTDDWLDFKEFFSDGDDGAGDQTIDQKTSPLR